MAIDPWQEATETGIIDAIAIGTAGAALPTAPDTGGTTTWGTVWTAHSAKLAEDDLSFTDRDGNVIEVMPPGTSQAQGLIVVDQPGILQSVDIMHYEIGNKVYTQASNVTIGTGTDDTGHATHTDTITRKAVIIQWAGLGWLYIPSALIFTMTPSGGRITLGKQTTRILIEGTSTLPKGYKWVHFQDAS